MARSLAGAVALVTGASRGIGREIALELGRLEAVVIGTATSTAGAGPIDAYLQSAGVRGRGCVMDVTSGEQTAQVVGAIEAEFGPIGVLAAVGVVIAVRRRREGDAYLAALAIVPIVILFFPLLAAAVGRVTVPWMLYRIGWLIPQPLLLARVAVSALIMG